MRTRSGNHRFRRQASANSKGSAGRVLSACMTAAAVISASGAAIAWTPLPVVSDPLVRMPGNQEDDGIVIESSGNCLNCHAGYQAAVEPGFNWKGSMMAQAARDPIFWATVTVAAQDSIWAVGRPNATDICIRCHTPAGWLAGRSDPTNGSALTGADFDGVSCDFCHSSYDPFFEATADGTREGTDWLGYWDETNASGTPSTTAANTTLQADRAGSAAVGLFNGGAFYGANHRPVRPAWTEAASGQYFVSTVKNRRASFADPNPKHTFFYSRFHKSRYYCGTCHDVTNPVLANLAYKNTAPGDGTTVLPTEQMPAYALAHVERTYSEFALSAYGTGAGADGAGPFAPAVFKTSRPGNKIASCQDCHMADTTGIACDKSSGVLRPTDSVEHPKSGLPMHDFQGGNLIVPRLLASSVTGSSNYDATNATLLRQGPNAITMDLTQGQPLDPAALLNAADRAQQQLLKAASLQVISFQPSTGSVVVRVVNQTGHKLPTGYPEGRRVFLNVRALKAGVLQREINPFDATADTLKGLDPIHAPNSPPLGASEQYRDDLVYESQPRSSLTGEAHTFHFALADGRTKDNRVPPKGFRISEAPARLSEPAWNGASDPGYFTAAEYAGGYDEVSISVPVGSDTVEARLYYQTTSREYVEFLRDEINGVGATLPTPTPSGEPTAYVAQSDPFFARLKPWGTTIWNLWDHNRNVAGFAPVLMAQVSSGATGDPCAVAGSNGSPCNDGNACTAVDTCAGGLCVGASPVVCTAASQCHLAGTCDVVTGLCTNPMRPDGTSCTDGSLCTQLDQCQNGACVGASPVVCTALDTCHVAGVCAPASGVCDNPPGNDGSPCAGGVCGGGVCIAADAGIPEAGVDAPDDAVTADTGTDAVVADVADDVIVSEAGGDATGQDSAVEDAAADAAQDAVSDGAVADAPVQDSSSDAIEQDVSSEDAQADAMPTDAATDTSVPDAPVSADAAGDEGGSAQAPAVADDGGCGCRTAPASSPRGLIAIALIGLGLLVRRRRGRRFF